MHHVGLLDGGAVEMVIYDKTFEPGEGEGLGARA